MMEHYRIKRRPLDVLVHYGVPGMRKGVRKERYYDLVGRTSTRDAQVDNGSSEKSNMSRYDLQQRQQQSVENTIDSGKENVKKSLWHIGGKTISSVPTRTKVTGKAAVARRFGIRR